MASRFYSTTLTTSAGGDLIAQIETVLGITIVPVAMTLISAEDVKVRVNDLVDAAGDPLYADLYLDTDSLYKLNLKEDEVVISSVKTEDAAQTVWLGIIF